MASIADSGSRTSPLKAKLERGLIGTGEQSLASGTQNRLCEKEVGQTIRYTDSATSATPPRATHGFHLWAWVIMPEHVHILLWPPFELISPDEGRMTGRIRGILSSLKRPVARNAIAYLHENAPTTLKQLAVDTPTGVEHRFWQTGSGHDENVTEPAALHALVEYVHLNPVRRGLVDKPEDWPWPSARDWHNLSDSTLKVDRTLPETIEVP